MNQLRLMIKEGITVGDQNLKVKLFKCTNR